MFVSRLKKKVVTEVSDRDEEAEDEDADYIVDEKARTAALTSNGIAKAEEFFHLDNLSDSDNSTLSHHINQAIKAHGVMKKDIDYVVKDGEVIIVDEFTGRLMFGRRYNEGLHQAIEAKEHVTVASENKTLATITFQNYFRLYDKLSGMGNVSFYDADTTILQYVGFNTSGVFADAALRSALSLGINRAGIVSAFLSGHDRPGQRAGGTPGGPGSRRAAAAGDGATECGGCPGTAGALTAIIRSCPAVIRKNGETLFLCLSVFLAKSPLDGDGGQCVPHLGQQYRQQFQLLVLQVGRHSHGQRIDGRGQSQRITAVHRITRLIL